jgi:hypothetical protein
MAAIGSETTSLRDIQTAVKSLKHRTVLPDAGISILGKNADPIFMQSFKTQKTRERCL